MLDRFGEPVDADQADTHQPHECDGGWLDRDADQPRPCPTCKPHLTRTRTPLPPSDPDRIRAGTQLAQEATTTLLRLAERAEKASTPHQGTPTTRHPAAGRAHTHTQDPPTPNGDHQ